MRFLFIIVFICVFGLVGTVVKGNDRQPTATAITVEPAVKEKAEPIVEDESIDVDLRRSAVESAIQSFRLSAECYQIEIGSADAVAVGCFIEHMPADQAKAKMDELGVPQVPEATRVKIEASVNKQYDLGRKYALEGKMDNFEDIVADANDTFFAELHKSMSRSEKLSRLEYIDKMVELTDSITERMGKNP